MPINRNSEISALRSVLRDLMALSALPMAWIGREPAAVAAGLADTLIELLQLEFVFVRLCAPGVTGGVDVTRGNTNTWAMFPEYVEAHLAKADWLPSMEITSDLGRGVEPGRGLVIPIGVNAEGGVIAATSDRIDFPTEIERLLLRLAANHAAAVFQGARLIEERTRAEEELRKARKELEVKVVERTSELRRSEAYLSAMVRDLRESERKLERSRAELAASRARIVTAADETRRRIERDLHDGVQQRLVSLGLAQRRAEAMVPIELPELRAQLSQVVDGLAGALEELLEISRGIHPAILAHGGIVPALNTLARRSAVRVELEVRTEKRPPEPVEVAVYYIVSEALTNAAKHAHASVVHVAVEARDGVLELSIRDDGCGGADPTCGSGLIGLADRIDALGGTIEVASPVGQGTTLLITLPIEEG